jgi:hypothetical protein
MTFAMSDRPEVQTMTPKADATGIDPATTFTLTFSEPVNKSDVEDRFALAVSNDKYSLSSSGVTLAQVYTPGTDLFAGGAGGGTQLTANPIYTTAAFTFAWSNNDQTVTATFRPGYKLPTDKDSSKIPQYAVGFAGNIRDAAGSGTRTDRFFRISPAQIGKNGYRFTVAADTTAPRLIGITALNNSPSAGGNDAVRFQFSETMVLYPNVNGPIPATANDAAEALHGANYAVWANSAVKPESFTDANGNGEGVRTVGIAAGATLYDGDATQSTILLNLQGAGVFAGSGESTWAGTTNTIEDPAGNQIETSNQTNFKSTNTI